jgi:hypothetical protein
MANLAATVVEETDDDVNDVGVWVVENDGNVAFDVPRLLLLVLLFRINPFAKLAFRKLVVDLDDLVVMSDIWTLPEPSTILLTLFILVMAATISRKH